MANVDENLNLGEIEETLPTVIRNQITKLYNELEERWRQQALQINGKPEIVFNDTTGAPRSPPGASLTQYREGTIYIDRDPAPNTVWILTEKVGSPPTSVWIQIG